MLSTVKTVSTRFFLTNFTVQVLSRFDEEYSQGLSKWNEEHGNVSNELITSESNTIAAGSIYIMPHL